MKAPLRTLPSVGDIEDAARNFPVDLVAKTPLLLHDRLSQRFDANIFIKNEGLQSIGSYKIRGATNAIRLRQAQSYVAASAGNHSQGVSLACRHYRTPATIFMPKTTPPQKVVATRNRGGEWVDVRLVGDDFDAAYRAAKQFSEESGADFIHPFDDADVIAGQGTVAAEVLASMKALDYPIDFLFVPVGGGGLLAGTLCYMRECSPHTTVIGVEPQHAAGMCASLLCGHVTTLEKMSTFVDGAAVRTPGQLAFDAAQRDHVRIMTIPEDRLCATMLRLLHLDKIVSEPAGVLSIDALESCRDEIRGKNVVCILSGSNVDASRYADIIRRKERFNKRRRYFTIKMPNRPDSLAELLNILKGKNVNIRHLYFEEEYTGGDVTVLMGLEAEAQESLCTAVDILSDSYDITEETNNPLLTKLLER